MSAHASTASPSIDIPVQCCRCRHKHRESERHTVQRVAAGITVSDLVCPRCGCKTYYDLRPEIAWCWASGLIEFGETAPTDSIVIASGNKSSLRTVVGALARHGLGQSEGKLLVPGVPEANGQEEAADALAKWLAWCAQGNGKKGRHGVAFKTEIAEAAE